MSGTVCPHGVAVAARADGNLQGCHRCALDEIASLRAEAGALLALLDRWYRNGTVSGDDYGLWRETMAVLLAGKGVQRGLQKK